MRILPGAVVAALVVPVLAGCGGDEGAHENDFTSAADTRDVLELTANVESATIADLCARWDDAEGEAFAWLEDALAADLDRGTVSAWVDERC